eukprot:g7705.t1
MHQEVPASEIALQIPDLLATVLRCLGPLEWVKCASVCPDWCDAILSRDEPAESGRAAPAPAATAMAPTPSTRSTASTAVAVAGEGGATARRAEGGVDEKAAAAAVGANLWREFAVTLMAGSSEGTRGPEASNHAGADDGGCPVNTGEHGRATFRPDAAGVTTRGGRWLTSNHARACFYRNVCLEGDPAVLGPPLTATAALVGTGGGSNHGRGGGVEVATVSLRDVTAVSLARYRQRRVFIKFLSLWIRYGGPTVARGAQIEVTHNHLQVTLDSRPPGRKQPPKKAKSAAERASSRGGSSRAANRRPKRCAATTALLHDALTVFTRLLVLCRRCRRPCTTLFATEEASGRSVDRRRRRPSQSPRGGGSARAGGSSTVAPEPSRRGRGGVALWVECQGEGCGVTSWVGVAAGTGGGGDGGGGGGGGGGGTNPPPWLTKFSTFVLNRAWKDINTLAEDHGTEWFSDTSPAAVQRRQDEARARSIGLDALARRGGASGGVHMK